MPDSIYSIMKTNCDCFADQYEAGLAVMADAFCDGLDQVATLIDGDDSRDWMADRLSNMERELMVMQTENASLHDELDDAYARMKQ